MMHFVYVCVCLCVCNPNLDVLPYSSLLAFRRIEYRYAYHSTSHAEDNV